MPVSTSIIRSIGGLAFDATFEESHDYELQVTDNPVESGVVVSDHAFMLPIKLTISAGVSDSPLGTRIANSFSGDGNNRPINALRMLTELQRSAEPFAVQTGLKLYRNMVCTNIKASQDKDTAGVLLFTADLREVIIVNTQTVKYKSSKVKANSESSKSGKGSKVVSDKQATPRPGAAARQASAIVDKGEVKGNDVTKKPSSLLYKTGLGNLL